MARPILKLKTDWDADGVFTGTGEDLTSRLKRVEWRRGRDHASQLTGRSVAGRLIAVLDNSSGDYSSFNTGSPIAGLALPGRKVQLDGGNQSGFPYDFPIIFNDAPQWTGYLQNIVPIPRTQGVNLVQLEAWGALGYLGAEDVEIAMATSKATGQAMEDILDEVGWPAADRDIDAGQTTMARFWLDQQKFLHACRIVERTEGGLLWEQKDGKLRFEDRHARLKAPHTVSQATFSDTLGATIGYYPPRQFDPEATIFNRFPVTIETFTVGALATLWTLPETGASSPLFAPGQTRTYWARYPNPLAPTDALSVDAWTTPVENTDYEANTASDGSGTDVSSDLVFVVTKFGNVMKMAITYNGTLPAYLTLLKARGTPVTRNDPMRLEAVDTASQTKYGERTFSERKQFIPDSLEGQAWADFQLSIYKAPIPVLSVRIDGNRDKAHLDQALLRDVSDRITVVATGGAGLGINEDFFIEVITHTIDAVTGRFFVTFDCSPASAYSNFWVLGTSVLGTSTVLAY